MYLYVSIYIYVSIALNIVKKQETLCRQEIVKTYENAIKFNIFLSITIYLL